MFEFVFVFEFAFVLCGIRGESSVGRLSPAGHDPQSLSSPLQPSEIQGLHFSASVTPPLQNHANTNTNTNTNTTHSISLPPSSHRKYKGCTFLHLLHLPPLQNHTCKIIQIQIHLSSNQKRKRRIKSPSFGIHIMKIIPSCLFGNSATCFLSQKQI